jgi:hypothetical protein
MDHFADIDRRGIGERNEGIRRGVRTLPLEGQSRETAALRPGSPLAYRFSKSTLPRLRRSGNAG